MPPPSIHSAFSVALCSARPCATGAETEASTGDITAPRTSGTARRARAHPRRGRRAGERRSDRKACHTGRQPRPAWASNRSIARPLHFLPGNSLLAATPFRGPRLCHYVRRQAGGRRCNASPTVVADRLPTSSHYFLAPRLCSSRWAVCTGTYRRHCPATRNNGKKIPHDWKKREWPLTALTARTASGCFVATSSRASLRFAGVFWAEFSSVRFCSRARVCV